MPAMQQRVDQADPEFGTAQARYDHYLKVGRLIRRLDPADVGSLLRALLVERLAHDRAGTWQLVNERIGEQRATQLLIVIEEKD